MKYTRQSKIIELITEYNIETQEELVDRLKQAGFDITQATISRDIRELKLSKISIENGVQKYVTRDNKELEISYKKIKVLKNAFISMDNASNLVIVKTLPGMAMATGATLDSLDFNEIVGNICGDDTIFIATKNEESAYKLMKKINTIIVDK